VTQVEVKDSVDFAGIIVHQPPAIDRLLISSFFDLASAAGSALSAPVWRETRIVSLALLLMASGG
jgi:hypothetical protein